LFNTCGHYSLLILLFLKISLSDSCFCRGEKTAQALENHLTSLEKKLDDLLASFEESERAKVEEGVKKKGSDNEADGDGKADGEKM